MKHRIDCNATMWNEQFMHNNYIKLLFIICKI